MRYIRSKKALLIKKILDENIQITLPEVIFI